MDKEIQQWYAERRSLLFLEKPGLVYECAKIVDGIRLGARGQEDVWRCFWDKPLWSNIRRCVMSRVCGIILDVGIPSYASMGSKAWSFKYVDQGKRKSGNWRSEDRWKPIGRLSKEYCRHRCCNEIPVSIAIWRVAMICNFANLLLRTERSKLESDALLKLANLDAKVSVELNDLMTLKSSLCPGWGVTTLLHGLTDLGISVKPDIHFARACIWSGLIDASMTCWTKKKIDVWLQRDTNKITLVKVARRLAYSLNGHKKSYRKTLREIDFVLMNCSDAAIIKVGDCGFPGW